MEWKMFALGVFTGMLLCAIDIIAYFKLRKKTLRDYEFFAKNSIWIKDGKNITVVTNKILAVIDEYMNNMTTLNNGKIIHRLSKGTLTWERHNKNK